MHKEVTSFLNQGLKYVIISPALYLDVLGRRLSYYDCSVPRCGKQIIGEDTMFILPLRCPNMVTFSKSEATYTFLERTTFYLTRAPMVYDGFRYTHLPDKNNDEIMTEKAGRVATILINNRNTRLRQCLIRS